LRPILRLNTGLKLVIPFRAPQSSGVLPIKRSIGFQNCDIQTVTGLHATARLAAAVRR
jgi:hypothetical protein